MPRRAASVLAALLGSLVASEAVAQPSAVATAQQLLVVDSAGWDAPRGVLRRFERPAAGAAFRQVGAPLQVALGRAGLAWRSDAGAPPPPLPGPRKREGDGRSPAGILRLGQMWGYAPAAPSGVRLPYQQADDKMRCVDDAQSPSYARIVRAPAASEPWRSAELLRMPTDHYKYLVVIDYNMAQPIAGAGSCIFLHVAPPPALTSGPTAGCTALVEAELLTVLRWLEPQKQPLLVQLPRDVMVKAAAALALPAEILPNSAP
jgi:L,D-peptidoglycan transpeptidase YkuD (ErfK/YbiS/YcfS/YnhG family)